MSKSQAARVAKQAKRSEQSAVEISGSDADKLIHERKRLAIISALAVNPSLTFGELKTLLELSDGNLSVHAQKLEAAGYVKCTKSFSGRMPKTTFAITKKGLKALEKYLDHMETLINTVRNARS
jgi:DNA-binding MarR family transcriptional regulator